jgi:hypothetical protein
MLVLAAALLAGCHSGLHAVARDAAATPGADSGLAGHGGSGGQAGAGAGGIAASPDGGPEVAVAPVDANPCLNIPVPDFDCGYGTPILSCVPRDGGWAWTATCPERPEDAGDRCSTIAAAIARQIKVTGTCTAVVRVDYASLAILSHALFCGRYQATDEASARATANTIKLLSSTGAGEGSLISGSSPSDEWVFAKPPSDIGGAAAVSARSGLLLFAGTTIYMGTGEILYPLDWDDSDLGSGCGSQLSVPIRTLSLAGIGSGARMTEAAKLVLDTALPSAFQQWGYVFDVLVLYYPRTVDPTDPKTAELIVLVNAGWLE